MKKSKLNHVNNDKSSSNRRIKKKNNENISLLSNNSPVDDTTAIFKTQYKDSFYLTAPRATPELSDITDVMSIVNITGTPVAETNTQNDQIEQVHNSIHLSSIIRSASTIQADNDSQINNPNSSLAIASSLVKTQKRNFNVNFNHADIDDYEDDNDDSNDDSSSQTESEIDIESLANNIHDKKKRKRYKNKKSKVKRKQKTNEKKSYICCIYFKKSREIVKNFVNTKFFVRGILGAILINTLSID